MPDDSKHILRTITASILPQDNRFVAQYEEAIEQLSESDPVTAFDLRTKGQISKLQNTIRVLGTAQGASTTEIAFFENSLKEALLPTLEKGLMELAQLHGRQTKERVEKILNAPFEPPKELESFLHNLQKQLVEQSPGLPPTT